MAIKPRPAQEGEINYALFDRFTLVHFLIGLLYGFAGLSFGMVIALALLWEILENPLKAKLPFVFPHATADTIQNALGDIGAISFGWALARYLL